MPKISALGAAVSVADADTVVIVQGGTTKKGTAAQVRAGLATSAQGAKADTALQPSDVGTAAAHAATDFATAAQGSKADTALQPIVAGSGIGTGGFAKHALVAGGAAGDISVAAIKTGDELNEVIQYIGAGVAITDVVDLTSEFAIKAGNGVINNTGGTVTTGSKLLVRWTKKTT